MANFLPKDYVSVATRVDQAHDKHKEKLSIETSFDIKDQTVIFSAKVTCGGQTFTGHSFGVVGREKAFEKLETVAVGRALAFAGFETRDGIASKEEMEVFEDNKKESDFEDSKAWMNEPELEALKSNLNKYDNADIAIKAARSKYKVSKAMEQNIRNLF